MPNSTARPQATLTSKALREIRRRIVEGELQLGEALSESALAGMLGMSKTPVREALVQLKREGLVEVYPQRGSFVFQVDANVVRDLCDVRRVLEVAALERAASQSWGQLVDAMEACVREMHQALARGDAASYRRLDAEFHRSLFRFCGNQLLADAHERIEFQIQSLRTRLSSAPENNAATLKEHVQIVEAVVARNLKRARDLLEKHIGVTEASYLRLLAG